MADVIITPANVALTTEQPTFRAVQYGATIDRGDVVYADTTSGNKHKLAQVDGTELEATAAGIALTPGGDGDYGVILQSGLIVIGGTLVKGQSYHVSTTAGGLRPASDYTTGQYITIVGQAISTSVLKVAIDVTGNN